MATHLWWFPAISFLIVFGGAALVLRIFFKDPETRMRARLQSIKIDGAVADANALMRDAYLRHLSPLERGFENLPGMMKLGQLAKQAGYRTPAYRLVLLCMGLMVGGFAMALTLLGSLPFAVMAALVMAGLFALQMAQKRKQRLQQFEEQLPDALDSMARAMRAGSSLMETFKFISEEMDEPAASEFNTAWTHLNYGISLKALLDDMLSRMPSMSLQALVAAILVQRETGGNLAEILDKLADVLRSRFRLERRVQTLSAEGRMSAWVLGLMPIALALGLSITTPGYLPRLYTDPKGPGLILTAVVLLAIGIVWIRRIVRIRF